MCTHPSAAQASGKAITGKISMPTNPDAHILSQPSMQQDKCSSRPRTTPLHHTGSPHAKRSGTKSSEECSTPGSHNALARLPALHQENSAASTTRRGAQIECCEGRERPTRFITRLPIHAFLDPVDGKFQYFGRIIDTSEHTERSGAFTTFLWRATSLGQA